MAATNETTSKILTFDYTGWCIFLIKVIITFVFIFRGIAQLSPKLDTELYFLMDSKFRGEYGNVIQNFISNTLNLTYTVQRVPLKRSLGFLSISGTMLLWAGNGGAMVGG